MGPDWTLLGPLLYSSVDEMTGCNQICFRPRLTYNDPGEKTWKSSRSF